MPTGRFAALDYDDESESSQEDDDVINNRNNNNNNNNNNSNTNKKNNKSKSNIKKNKHSAPATKSGAAAPSFEDLSACREDEETFLNAVYGTDFTKQAGAWGCAKLMVHVRPPDIVDPTHIGSELQLAVQLNKNYPHVVPKIELLNVKGLSKEQKSDLFRQLNDRALELSKSGLVMVWELVQVTENFLLQHNQDPTMSAYDQMKARQAKEKEAQEKKQQSQRDQELKLLLKAAAHETTDTSIPHSNSITSLLNSPTSAEQSVPRNIPIGTGTSVAQVVPTDVKRELARQNQALADAEQRRKQQHLENTVGRTAESLGGPSAGAAGEGGFFKVGGGGSGGDDHNDDDDLDDDGGAYFDYLGMDEDRPQNPLGVGSSSRYQSDFIELGILGRGGGGEVVKVRNRLDRRICRYIPNKSIVVVV
jgi:hypothetical protein